MTEALGLIGFGLLCLALCTRFSVYLVRGTLKLKVCDEYGLYYGLGLGLILAGIGYTMVLYEKGIPDFLSLLAGFAAAGLTFVLLVFMLTPRLPAKQVLSTRR